MLRVISVKGLAPNDPSVTYIGRDWAGWRASALGNPFHVKGGDRGATLPKYREWLRRQWVANGPVKAELLSIARRVKAGEDVQLGCWCKHHGPNTPCHGDVLKEVVQILIEKGVV